MAPRLFLDTRSRCAAGRGRSWRPARPVAGWPSGRGNSVTDCCKVENYLAMLDETRAWNREHGC